MSIDHDKITPQQAGWDEKVPLNYDSLMPKPADGDDAVKENQTAPEWYSTAAKYEWSDDYGDVGPSIPELEEQLFDRHTKTMEGAWMEHINAFSVTQEGPTRIAPVKHFDDAGLHPLTLQNVKLCHYISTTPVQAYCIPAVLSGHDVIAIAQTGSGKTAAYMIPVLSKLMGKAKKLAAPRPNPVHFNITTDRTRAEPLVLIICPTRELAIQIFDEARRMCYRTMLRPSVVYGGGPRRQQLEDLQHGCDVLIGTPGRLMDFITTEPRWLSLRRVKYTILDEADEMLDASWEETMKPMLAGGAAQDDGDHQFLMFSATFSKAAREIAREYLSDDHTRIRVGRAGSTHKNVVQTVMWVEETQKKQALVDLLMSLSPARTMIFVATTGRVDVFDDELFNKDFPVTSIHSKRTQREREDAIRAFRVGTMPIMITTSVSARGLDIKNVMHIINVDLPTNAYGGIGDYTHRIGRTARIGNKGRATSFYNDRNADIAQDLVKVLLENGQEVPEFLSEYEPQGVITWNDDTDNEGEDQADSGAKDTAANDDGWGAPTATAETTESGW